MKKIAVIIDDLFEDSEYVESENSFTKLGHKLTRVGLKKEKTVKGKKQGN